MVMDVRDMSAFDTRSFAAVLDKGSIFAIMCFGQLYCTIF